MPKAPVASYVPVVRTGNIALRLRPDLDQRRRPGGHRPARRQHERRPGRQRRRALRGEHPRPRSSTPAASTSRRSSASLKLTVLRRLGARFLRAAPRRQRRFQPHHRRPRRQGQARPLGDRRRRPAPSARPSRSRRSSRSPEAPMSQLSSTGPSPIAGCTTARAGVIENSAIGVRGGDRRPAITSNATCSSRATACRSSSTTTTSSG